VSAPTDADLSFLRERMGDVEIGRLRSGEDTIDLPVGIRGETLPSHVGVFATTGMGKSNLMKVLAGQLLAASGRYAMLLFDPHGEYLEGGAAGRRGLAHHPWASERLRVYSPSPRAGQASLLRLSLAELTVDDLRTAWKFTGPQSEALESAYALLGDKGVWLTRLAEEDPEVLKDADDLSKVGDDVDYTITVTNKGLRDLHLDSIEDDKLGDLLDAANANFKEGSYTNNCGARGASLAAGGVQDLRMARLDRERSQIPVLHGRDRTDHGPSAHAASSSEASAASSSRLTASRISCR
jgi:hypothetical protein